MESFAAAATSKTFVVAPLVRTAEHHLSPLLDPVKTVVVQAGAGDVELVMVDGRIVKRDGDLVGDPTEGALVVLAEKGGVDVAGLRQERPRMLEVPFDSDY